MVVKHYGREPEIEQIRKDCALSVSLRRNGLAALDRFYANLHLKHCETPFGVFFSYSPYSILES